MARFSATTTSCYGDNNAEKRGSPSLHRKSQCNTPLQWYYQYTEYTSIIPPSLLPYTPYSVRSLGIFIVIIVIRHSSSHGFLIFLSSGKVLWLNRYMYEVFVSYTIKQTQTDSHICPVLLLTYFYDYLYVLYEVVCC